MFSQPGDATTVEGAGTSKIESADANNRKAKVKLTFLNCIPEFMLSPLDSSNPHLCFYFL